MLNTEKQLKLSEFTKIYDLIISEFTKIYDLIISKDHILRKITENIDFSFVNKLQSFLDETVQQALNNKIIKSTTIIVDATH